jgi:Ser/Thr protein kinase RdoA (MazF antagonist)
MSQLDIYEAINNLRRINDDWHRATSIIKYMKANCKLNGNEKKVYSYLLRLSAFNLIEWRRVGVINTYLEFRGKE